MEADRASFGRIIDEFTSLPDLGLIRERVMQAKETLDDTLRKLGVPAELIFGLSMLAAGAVLWESAAILAFALVIVGLYKAVPAALQIVLSRIPELSRAI